MKPDDSSLGEAERKFVEERAAGLLNRADSWGVFPTPVDDLVAAAGLKVAPKGFFDPGRIMDFVRERGIDAAKHIRAAISKVLGIYDADDQIIHVDDSVAVSKQGFLKLHETGHHELPTHRKLFRVFQDCKKTLCPEIADQFEREANNFARYVLFQGDSFARQAADHSFGIMTPIGMAKGFGASVLSQTGTKGVIGLEANCSGGEDLELFGERRAGIVGIPRLSLPHHVDHLDAGQDDGGTRLRLEAEH